jgi:hypothetical protein
VTPRTELWVGARPPNDWPTVTPETLKELPDGGPVAVLISALENTPEAFPSQLHRVLQRLGRRLDSVVIGADVLDLEDGYPLDTGVGAHRRAAWFEVADRIAGAVTPVMSRLQPGVQAWSEVSPGSWDPHRSDRRAAWVDTLAKRSKAPGTLLLEAHRPLHPTAFTAWMMTEWPGVERAVGFIWTADQPDVVVRLERAGQHPMVRGAGVWWVNSPRRYWPRDTDALLRLKESWHNDFGDRICRIALIGTAIDPTALQAAFEQALIPKASVAQWHNSAVTPDPFAGLL